MIVMVYKNNQYYTNFLFWQVGACIVNPQNKIVGIGYNSLPEGCNEDEFEFWENRDVRAEGYEKTKYAYGRYK